MADAQRTQRQKEIVTAELDKLGFFDVAAEETLVESILGGIASLNLNEAEQIRTYAQHEAEREAKHRSEVSKLQSENQSLKQAIAEKSDEVSNLRASLFKAGRKITSLGTGSTTPEETLQSRLPKANREVKELGAQLTHPFYRSFLHKLDGCIQKVEHNAAEYVEPFTRCYNSCFEENSFGITQPKNSSGHIRSCPETVISSILGGAVNRFLCAWSPRSDGPIDLLWCSEVEMKSKVDGKDRRPGSDGVLCIVHGHSLRGIACQENKIGDFDDDAIRESYANAIDILAQKGDGSPMMPVVSLRMSFGGKDSVSFEAHGLVPGDTEETLASVNLFKGETIAKYLGCIAALFDAAKECLAEVDEKKSEWASFHGNLAISPDDCIYKLFPGSSQRQPNLDLVKKFIDNEAEVIKVTNRGRVLKMQHVGSVCGEDPIPASRFATISAELRALHELGYVHCDIRFHNLLLCGVSSSDQESGAKIIDFDVARSEKKEECYLTNLLEIQDGGRHKDVLAAIEMNTLGGLRVKKEHDWFSLREVMKLFEPVEENNKDKWEKMIEHIDHVSVGDNCKFKIKLKVDAKTKVWPQRSSTHVETMPVVHATGSPKEGKN